MVAVTHTQIFIPIQRPPPVRGHNSAWLTTTPTCTLTWLIKGGSGSSIEPNICEWHF